MGTVEQPRSAADGRTVERALSLLALVCERGQASLTEAARSTGLSPATALRLLRTLETQDFLRRDPAGDYRPGARTIRVGAQALSHEPVVEAGQPELDRVALETGESAYLSICGHGATALYVAIAEGTDMVRYVSWVGHAIPLKGTAAGIALAGQVGAAGFACVRGDVDEHAVSIAVPVLVIPPKTGTAVEAALSVVVPADRIDDAVTASIADLLLSAAARIVQRLADRQDLAAAVRRPRDPATQPEPATPAAVGGQTRTVDRALLALASVCELGTATMSELARETELSPTTVARLLRTLDAQEFVRRDDGRYRPGARIIKVGALALSSANIAALGQLELDRIARETGESSYLSLPSPGRQAILAAIAPGTHPIRHVSWVGRTVSLDNSAVGAALLGGIGRRGYANLVRVISPDTTSIASPVHSHTRVVAALSVVVPNFRADPANLERIGGIVANAADRLAVQLGVEPLDPPPAEAGPD